jgi:cell division protein FtsA
MGFEEDGPSEGFPVRASDGRVRTATLAQLRSIVEPRIFELFRMVKALLGEHVSQDHAISQAVLTGGGANLRGIERFAGDFFGIPVRVGAPATTRGLTDAVKQPQYATAVGLALYGSKNNGVPNGERRRKNPFAGAAAWLSDLWN